MHEADGEAAAGPKRSSAGERAKPAGARVRRPQMPVSDALELAHDFGRYGYGDLQVRHTFLRRPSPGQAPPVRQLFDGGQGNDVALKMLLALWWARREVPFTWDEPNFTHEGWALLCGRPSVSDDLLEPGEEGRTRKDRSTTRTVARAIERLAGEHPTPYLVAERAPGRSAILTLVDYTLPTSHLTYGLDGSRRLAPEHRYCRVPSTLITKGWLGVLPGKALLVLLAIIDHIDDQTNTKMAPRISGDRTWMEIRSYPWAAVGPSMWSGRYGFGKDAWFDGLRMLRLWGLVRNERKLLSPAPGYRRRPTTSLTVVASQLSLSPVEVYDQAIARFEAEAVAPPDPLNRPRTT